MGTITCEAEDAPSTCKSVTDQQPHRQPCRTRTEATTGRRCGGQHLDQDCCVMHTSGPLFKLKADLGVLDPSVIPLPHGAKLNTSSIPVLPPLFISLIRVLGTVARPSLLESRVRDFALNPSNMSRGNKAPGKHGHFMCQQQTWCDFNLKSSFHYISENLQTQYLLIEKPPITSVTVDLCFCLT